MSGRAHGVMALGDGNADDASMRELGRALRWLDAWRPLTPAPAGGW